MGYQSSRIIWGKQNVDPENFSPITLYDENYTIYQKGNYALAVPPGLTEGLKLWKCIVPETNGPFVVQPEGGEPRWQEIKGVKPFTTTKQYKIGAKCIYGDYVYSCIQPVIYTNYDPIIRVPDQYPDYWELVKQDVELGYTPMDHKSVYYDDGHNKNKWHKKMYYIPPWYEDEVDITRPITLYSEEWESHVEGPQEEDKIYLVNYIKGSEVIRQVDGTTDQFKLYKYKRTEPYGGPWKASYWDEEEGVEYFVPFRSYFKGDRCIFRQTTYSTVPVSKFSRNTNYRAGQFVLDYIKINEFPLPELIFTQPNYVERLKGGEKLMGCYRILVDITAGEYWSLPHHVDPGEQRVVELQEVYQVDEIPYPSSPPGHGHSGLYPPVVFDDTMHFLIATPPGEEEFTLYRIDWDAETDEDFAKIVTYTAQSESNYYTFKCIKSHSLGSFYRPYWEQLYTNIDGNIGLYGIIWEKLGQPGGGGYPFFSPIVMVNLLNGYNCQINKFNYFPGNNYMEMDKRFQMSRVGSETETDIYFNGGFGCMIITNGIQMFCYTIGMTAHKRFLHNDILMCAFGEWGVASIPNHKYFPDERIIISPSGFMFLDAESNTKEFYRANCSMIGPGVNSISKIFEETSEPQYPITNDEYYYIYGVNPIVHTVNGHILYVTKVRYYLSVSPLYTIQKFYSYYTVDESGNLIQLTSESEQDSPFYSYGYYLPGLYYDSIDESKLNIVIGETLIARIDETTDPLTTQQRANIDLHCTHYNYRYVEEQEWISYDFSYHTIMYIYRPSYQYEQHTTGTLARLSNLSGTKFYWFQIRTYGSSISGQSGHTLFSLVTVSNGSSSATIVTGTEITGPVRSGSQGLIWATEDIAYIFLLGNDEGDDSMRGLYKLTLNGAPTLTKVWNYTKPGFQYPYSYLEASNYIKYYKDQTVKIKVNNQYAYITKILIHQNNEFEFARLVPRTSEPGVYTDTADVYLDFGLFIHCPYCSEGTGNPRNIPNGLFGSMICRMMLDGMAEWGSIGLCLPGFPSDSSFANAFFWLSGTAVQGSSYYTWDIDPAYGGPEEGGFWQGEERMLEHTGGQGSSSQGGSGSSSSNEGGSGSSESNN